jgi:hypothetical protein
MFKFGPQSKQVKGLIFNPDRRVEVHEMALDTNTLTGPPDDKGRPQAWIMARTLSTLSSGQPYVMLRADDLAPVALPGEKTAAITLDQRRAAVERRRSEVYSGEKLKDPLEKILWWQLATQIGLFGLVAVVVLVVVLQHLPWFK